MDRDPDTFKTILKFLRSGSLVEEIPRRELFELQEDAQYFQLTSLMEIIQQRLSVEDHNNSGTKDEVNVIVNGITFKCKPHALQYSNKDRIDQNGDFNAIKDLPSHHICPRQRNECRCVDYHGPTQEDLVRRVLRRLEDNRVGDVQPPEGTELCEDFMAAFVMGLLPRYPNYKYFY